MFCTTTVVQLSIIKASLSSVVSTVDLISDGYGGEVNDLSQLDWRRSAAHHWHVVGEHAKAEKDEFVSVQSNVMLQCYLDPGNESSLALALSMASKRSRRRTNPTKY